MLKRLGISLLISLVIQFAIYYEETYSHTDYPGLAASILLLLFCYLFLGVAVVATLVYLIRRTFIPFLAAFIITANCFNLIGAWWLDKPRIDLSLLCSCNEHNKFGCAIFWPSVVTEAILIGLCIAYRMRFRRSQGDQAAASNAETK